MEVAQRDEGARLSNSKCVAEDGAENFCLEERAIDCEEVKEGRLKSCTKILN